MRFRKRNEDGVPNWYPTLTVRFLDNTGRLSKNATPVATTHGIIDILVLLPGKSAAESRSRLNRLRKDYEVQDTNCILNLTVRFRDRAGG